MPAYDRYHFAVIHALEHENWEIVTDQRWLQIGQRYVFPDIIAQQNGNSTIVVEVKTFERRSQVEALAEALGKIMLYRIVIEAQQSAAPVILAVPVPAAEGILSETLGALVIAGYQIPVLVVDVIDERIVEWRL